MDMKLSFTVALLKDLSLLGNELNSLKSFRSPVDVMEDFKPYILHNDTGNKLQFWFPISEAFSQSNKTTIDTYEMYKFGLPIEHQATGVGLGQRRARVNIKIDGYRKIRDVSIDTLGEHYYILESDVKRKSTYFEVDCHIKRWRKRDTSKFCCVFEKLHAVGA